jgi:hypothetical protein
MSGELVAFVPIHGGTGRLVGCGRKLRGARCRAIFPRCQPMAHDEADPLLRFARVPEHPHIGELNLYPLSHGHHPAHGKAKLIVEAKVGGRVRTGEQLGLGAETHAHGRIVTPDGQVALHEESAAQRGLPNRRGGIRQHLLLPPFGTRPQQQVASADAGPVHPTQLILRLVRQGHLQQVGCASFPVRCSTPRSGCGPRRGARCRCSRPSAACSSGGGRCRRCRRAPCRSRR